MGASKKLAVAKTNKAAVEAARQDVLAGLFAIGGSVATICTEGLNDLEREEIAEQLMGLLNQIEATKPLPDFTAVVKGAMTALGYEPVK